MAVFGAVDAPRDGALVAGEGFIVSGFAFDEVTGPFVRVVVRNEGREVGATVLRQHRPDVKLAIPSATDDECGYRIAVSGLAPAPATPLTIEATFKKGAAWQAEIHVATGPHDYRAGPYGTLVDDNVDVVYHRENIYSVGPPSAEPSIECVALLRSFLAPGESVIDVGCGLGAYAAPLFAAGVAWQGCEVNADFVTQMSERGLPVTHVTGEGLPFADAEFESAICIEVLEHIVDYDRFVAEVARVTRRRALFSVPNSGAIPILADRLVVPWHLLEADHKNFFTHVSLRSTLARSFKHVEVFPYGTMPLASSNDTAVYYHLLAVAEV